MGQGFVVAFSLIHNWLQECYLTIIFHAVAIILV
jgi:hypothetical protein